MHNRYLDDLPQYHFEREDFVKVFLEVFTSDEIFDIEVMCQGIKKHRKFPALLCRGRVLYHSSC